LAGGRERGEAEPGDEIHGGRERCDYGEPAQAEATEENGDDQTRDERSHTTLHGGIGEKLLHLFARDGLGERSALRQLGVVPGEVGVVLAPIHLRIAEIEPAQAHAERDVGERIAVARAPGLVAETGVERDAAAAGPPRPRLAVPRGRARAAAPPRLAARWCPSPAAAPASRTRAGSGAQRRTSTRSRGSGGTRRSSGEALSRKAAMTRESKIV